MIQPGVYASVPVWAGRSEWLAEVEQRSGISGRSATRLTVARVLAEAADRRTGRGVALAVPTVAKRADVSERTVRNVRAWLAREGLAVEVLRGRHLTAAEREQRRAIGAHGIRTASVWALTGGRADHPRRFSADGSSSESNSPKRATRAGMKRKRERTARDAAPRPLAVQRTAAEVARRVPHLLADGRHIGALADVVARALGEAVEGATASDVLSVAEAGGRGRSWAADSARDTLGWFAARLRLGRASGALTAAERAARGIVEREARAARRRAEREAAEARRASVTGEGTAAARAALAAVRARRAAVAA